VSIVAELVVEGGQPRGAVDVVIIRIVLLEIDDRIGLAESVNLQRRFVVRRICARAGCGNVSVRHAANGIAHRAARCRVIV
jgi:hypothetical protein